MPIVKANPTLFVEVRVQGSSPLGRTKLGAVPFVVEADHAVEANHAAKADTATSATNATTAATANAAGGAGNPLGRPLATNSLHIQYQSASACPTATKYVHWLAIGRWK